MTTVLVAEGSSSRLITAHRCSLVERLLVRARAFGLDATLARGVNPDSRAALSLRARALIAPKCRCSLARQLRGVMRTAERPPRPFDSRVTLCRREIARERERLEMLADLLDGADAVDSCGVARAEMLLRDGASPLYRAGPPRELGARVQQVIDALEIDSSIYADA
jgi:hypothetical protein